MVKVNFNSKKSLKEYICGNEMNSGGNITVNVSGIQQTNPTGSPISV